MFRSDVAYFDGLNETIISVGLVKPKAGIFQGYVKYLLILTTTVEITILGVTIPDDGGGNNLLQFCSFAFVNNHPLDLIIVLCIIHRYAVGSRTDLYCYYRWNWNHYNC